MINTINSKGSVGRYISKFKPGTSSLNGSESGVRETINHIIFSNEKIIRSKTPNNAGSKLIMNKSFFIMKYKFNKRKLTETK
jgi:hypothetical protein